MARKIIRRRKPSMKTALGITKAKRSFAKATGIPTTKSGRKRKALNSMTGGAYGKYQRTRAKVNRPFKTMKRVSKGTGCLVPILCLTVLLSLAVIIL
ncbi:MAG: hypothetical protein GX096_07955 [Clostridiales bacterium]|nr:hypothetical protein [Clostridiales bacterium]